MRSYPVKVNPIGSVVSEILWYTDKHTSCYFIMRIEQYFTAKIEIHEICVTLQILRMTACDCVKGNFLPVIISKMGGGGGGFFALLVNLRKS